MVKRKTGLEVTAFQPPFYKSTSGLNSKAYNIPEEYEIELIDIYSKLTELEPDIKVKDLPNILRDELGIPIEIIPKDNEFQSWAIDSTNILDFEKWLYNGYFWLLLINNINDVDMLWQDVWSALNNKEVLDKEKLRNEKLYLNDVKKLIEIGKLDASAIGMLQTAGNGKVYISYVDFFILLGRLGMFG